MLEKLDKPVFTRPIKDQIKAIRDVLRAKRGTISVRPVDIDYDTINTTKEQRATLFVPTKNMSHIQ